MVSETPVTPTDFSPSPSSYNLQIDSEGLSIN